MEEKEWFVFSDSNLLVSKLHWHPNQENCFLWQMHSALFPSLSRFPSMSLTLSKTHAAPLLSLISKLERRRSPQTQTRCAKSSESCSGVSKKVRKLHKHKQNHRTAGKQTDYRPCHFIKRQTIIWESLWASFCVWPCSMPELADAGGSESGAHGWLSALNWVICKHTDQQ